jgi:hypothetical protein
MIDRAASASPEAPKDGSLERAKRKRTQFSFA